MKEQKKLSKLIQFLLLLLIKHQHKAPIVIISGGLGSFEPRKPKIDNLSFYEDKGVNYMVKNPENLNKKNIFISGGGDSALEGYLFC